MKGSNLFLCLCLSLTRSLARFFLHSLSLSRSLARSSLHPPCLSLSLSLSHTHMLPLSSKRAAIRRVSQAAVTLTCDVRLTPTVRVSKTNMAQAGRVEGRSPLPESKTKRREARLSSGDCGIPLVSGVS